MFESNYVNFTYICCIPASLYNYQLYAIIVHLSCNYKHIGSEYIFTCDCEYTKQGF